MDNAPIASDVVQGSNSSNEKDILPGGRLRVAPQVSVAPVPGGPPLPISFMPSPILPFSPIPLMPPTMVVPKRAPAAVAEPQKDGPGFPFPKGGWAYGMSIGDPYYYLKTDEHINKIRESERRVVMQLTYIYLLDDNSQLGQFVNSLQPDEIVVATQSSDSTDNVVKLILNSNVIKHIEHKIDDIVNLPLDPSRQILLLSDSTLDVSLSEQTIQHIRQFVRSGGILLSFNTAVSALDKIFPGKLKYRRGLTTVDKPIEIKIDLCPIDEEIFGRYAAEVRQYQRLVLRKGIQRFTTLDPCVKILLEETGPCPNQPLVVKFSEGDGIVYHTLTCHLASKVGSQGGTTFQGLSEMLDLPSKELAAETIQELKKRSPLPLMTVTAWQAALACGYFTSINTARSLILTLDCFFSLLRTHLKRTLKKNDVDRN